ncbi:sensor histidine kinase [Alicyclobacillus acidocaldarius]|uniref:histidine kinase n=1 Tax=Alicyclobacillus acidocaldarius (strain Tc-4-1) TaxID=1048834 RepID=F8II48_ALIAT|nr:HAMP domain-containing sensor histidine kinase [Alicyclobacillus acidocaldarius]AEJ44528.1 histidine kinase [Alicyclobacillus acidocaldarius subsp. acidocaldarius Tc-4-1]
MFRRMYITVASLLIVSTGLLLVLVGLAVYHELTNDVARDAEQAMAEAVPAVERALTESVYRDGLGPPVRDDLGNTIFYYAVGPAAVAHSPHAPVPFSVVHGEAVLKHFVTFTYDNEPYRLYTVVVPDPTMAPALIQTSYQGSVGRASTRGLLATSALKDAVRGIAGSPALTPTRSTVVLYMYCLITQERSMLTHTLHLMEFIGGAGFLLAIAGDLVLARRLVQPAFQTWAAYQEAVLELSHELQTPIATASAMLANRDVPEEAANEIRRELDRASKMISDMLYLSKLRSGLVDDPPEPVAVSDLTLEIAERYQPVARAEGIELRGQAEEGLYVYTNQGEWERLVSTLLKNVIDHAKRPSTAVWSLYRQGQWVVLTVENDVADQAGDRPRAPERGVGLQIVERLVHRMRGRLRIDADEDRFFVELHVPLLRPH